MRRLASRQATSRTASSSSVRRSRRMLGCTTLSQETPCSWATGSISHIVVSTPAPASSVVSCGRQLSARSASKAPSAHHVSSSSVSKANYDASVRSASMYSVNNRNFVGKVPSTSVMTRNAAPLPKSQSITTDLNTPSRLKVDKETKANEDTQAVLSHTKTLGSTLFVAPRDLPPSPTFFASAGVVVERGFSAQDVGLRQSRSTASSMQPASEASMECTVVCDSPQAKTIGVKTVDLQPIQAKSAQPLLSNNSWVEPKRFPEVHFNASKSNTITPAQSLRAGSPSEAQMINLQSSALGERYQLKTDQTSCGARAIVHKSFGTLLSQTSSVENQRDASSSSLSKPPAITPSPFLQERPPQITSSPPKSLQLLSQGASHVASLDLGGEKTGAVASRSTSSHIDIVGEKRSQSQLIVPMLIDTSTLSPNLVATQPTKQEFATYSQAPSLETARKETRLVELTAFPPVKLEREVSLSGTLKTPSTQDNAGPFQMVPSPPPRL